MQIRQATVADLDQIVPLFEAYRAFYRQPADPEAASRFLRERMELGESVIFLAFEDETALGFVQLYPSFSSSLMARTFILNDLFVAPEGRRQGTGGALLEAASSWGRSVGAVRLDLATELTNTTAQALYEKSGWKRDTVFCVYRLTL